MRIKEEKECRICKGELERILDLGNIYPSTFLSYDEKMSEDDKAPLILDRCKECGLVQLEHTIDLDMMFRQYWYNSSLNKSMVSSLQNVVNDIEFKSNLKDGDTVVDIGCNDGTLLGLYENKSLTKVGFEPALNVRPQDGTVTVWIPEYFSAEQYYTYQKHPNHPEWYGVKAKVVTAIAMFYDLPDPNKFVEDVKEILADDGIFVIQFTDLASMFRVCAFDNICHEHLEYYRLVDVYHLLSKHGLQVIDVSYNHVNGGSIRITAAHKGQHTINERVVMALVDEENFLKVNTIEDFKKCIDTTRFKIKEFLEWAEFHGHQVYLLGASTKGNTLLQVCGVTSEQVPFAGEVNKDKFGLRTVGSNIEIVSEEDALIKHPDYFIVPVWHFKKSIYSNPRIVDYMRSGGKLIFPLPYFHVAFMDFENVIKETRI